MTHYAAAEATTSLYKCLATTNGIESPRSGVASRMANVTRWRDEEMTECSGGFGLAIGIYGRWPQSWAVKL